MKQFLNIHHTATFAKDDVAHQFNGVNASHKKRWEGRTLSKLGFYGGYHYLVERDGTVGQFRGDDEVGAHNDQQEMNFKAIGVCFAGNMDVQSLTKAQFTEGLKLMLRLQTAYGIPDSNIKSHRDYKNTHCPGGLIPKDMGIINFFKLNAAEMPLSWQEGTRKWAETVLDDVDGFINNMTPYKVLELVRKATNK